jgi:hypothetical protein
MRARLKSLVLGVALLAAPLHGAWAQICGEQQTVTGPYDDALLAFARAQGLAHPEAFRNVVNAIRNAPDRWLPSCYVSERQAERMGWHRGRDLWNVAPHDSIGGMFYHNWDHRLPDRYNRHWIEADLDYEGGHRGSDRLIFARNMSDEWVFYVTTDHYRSFTRFQPPSP